MVRELSIGDRVQLCLPLNWLAYMPQGLIEYDGCVFEISRIVLVGHGRNTPGSLKGSYYELDGCVSEKGVPYGVIKAWLIPVREEDEE